MGGRGPLLRKAQETPPRFGFARAGTPRVSLALGRRCRPWQRTSGFHLTADASLSCSELAIRAKSSHRLADVAPQRGTTSLPCSPPLAASICLHVSLDSCGRLLQHFEAAPAELRGVLGSRPPQHADGPSSRRPKTCTTSDSHSVAHRLLLTQASGLNRRYSKPKSGEE